MQRSIKMKNIRIRFAPCVAALGFLLGSTLALADDFELRGDPEAGKAPYQQQCASCHGNSAKGDGPASRAFNPPPSDLTRDDLEAERMFLATRDGGMAVGLAATMPAFSRSMDEQTIHNVVAYIKSLRDE
jgi:mono/diheme cytochrome c family protein